MMDIKKIAIVGHIGHESMSASTAKRLIAEHGVKVEIVDPESVNISSVFQPPPIQITAPEIYVNNYFTPPLTRRQRRAKARKNSK